MSKPTPRPWLRKDCLVYALTDKGVNRFTAQFQGGGPDAATDEELVKNADYALSAVNNYDELRRVLGDLLAKVGNITPYLAASHSNRPTLGIYDVPGYRIKELNDTKDAANDVLYKCKEDLWLVNW